MFTKEQVFIGRPSCINSEYCIVSKVIKINTAVMRLMSLRFIVSVLIQK